MALGSDDDNQDNNSEGVASINNNHDHTQTKAGHPVVLPTSWVQGAYHP
jgi:hypothetical protein